MKALFISLMIVSFSSYADEKIDFAIGKDNGCSDVAKFSNLNQAMTVLSKLTTTSAYKQGYEQGFKECKHDSDLAKAGLPKR